MSRDIEFDGKKQEHILTPRIETVIQAEHMLIQTQQKYAIQSPIFAGVGW